MEIPWAAWWSFHQSLFHLWFSPNLHLSLRFGDNQTTVSKPPQAKVIKSVFFIGSKSDYCLTLSVIQSVMFLRLHWCDPCLWRSRNLSFPYFTTPCQTKNSCSKLKLKFGQDFAQVHSQDMRRFSGGEFLLIISWGGRLFCMPLPCSCCVVAVLLLWCCYACKTKPNQTIIHYQKVIENTKEYQKISKLSRNFRKYPIVPENTRKYKKVSETTRKYKEVSEAIRHYQKVPENTKNYKKWPNGQEMARMWLAEKMSHKRSWQNLFLTNRLRWSWQNVFLTKCLLTT